VRHVAAGCAVQLLPGFECLIDGRPVELSALARRLIARLCVAHPGRVNRANLIEDLDLTRSTDPRACVRKALWQTNLAGRGAFLTATRNDLHLAEAVWIDYDVARQSCHSLINCGFADETVAATPSWIVDAAGSSLLAGWDEEWLSPAQQEWEVLRLEVLHGIAEAELRSGHLAAALIHADRLLRADPMREGAWRTVLRALLNNGHRAAAMRRYAELTDLLHEELGIGPSSELQRLLGVSQQ
jgi:DNA-binding SARP family transcriptional activator